MRGNRLESFVSYAPATFLFLFSPELELIGSAHSKVALDEALGKGLVLSSCLRLGVDSPPLTAHASRRKRDGFSGLLDLILLRGTSSNSSSSSGSTDRRGDPESATSSSVVSEKARRLRGFLRASAAPPIASRRQALPR